MENNLFQDRISTQANRVKITPSGENAYFATIERADEPTTTGTPINASILNSINDKAVEALENSTKMNSRINIAESDIVALKIDTASVQTDVSYIKDNVTSCVSSVNSMQSKVVELDNKVKNAVGSKVTSNSEVLDIFNADTKLNKNIGSVNMNKTLVVNALGELEASDDLFLIKQILLKIILNNDGTRFVDLAAMNNYLPNATLKISNLEEII